MCHRFASIHFRLPRICPGGGGVTGAEFLTGPMTPRYNAMGGVIDGLGNDLEAIHYNAALLATLQSLSLSLSVNPYPNDVSHYQISTGLPMFGGVAAASAQLLNTGGFTYINENLQPGDTVSVYDAAATVGYSRFVWKELSAGMCVKTIYRKLGEYNALAFGTDIGAGYRFETPHFASRPKPPKVDTLKKKLHKKKKSLQKEREKCIQRASKTVEELQKDIQGLSSRKADTEAKLLSAEEEKKPPLLEKIKQIDDQLASLRNTIVVEEDKRTEEIVGIERWYTENLEKSEEEYNKSLLDLKYVISERERLFAPVNETENELSDEHIDSSIDETIEKSRSFLKKRVEELSSAKVKYTNQRQGRIEEIDIEIASYGKTIEEVFGTRVKKLQEELDALKEQRDALSVTEDEQSKVQLDTLQKLINEKEKELQIAQGDPWMKKLLARIKQKKQEQEELGEDIKQKGEDIHEAVEEITKDNEKDIKGFIQLRVWLKRELKKAKLKRELELLEARKGGQRQKALDEYEEKEKALYLQLMSLKYDHEEKILGSRKAALREDYENGRYETETEHRKALERLEDEFSFQERYLLNLISELENSLAGGDESAKARIEESKKELDEKKRALQKSIESIESDEKKLLAEKKSVFETEIEKLEWQIRLTRLIYLQTDSPYLNTSVNLAVRNFGSKVKFVEEGYPLPASVHLGVGYAVLNKEKHTIKLGVQANFPIYDEITVGAGAEYGFLHRAFFRAGYTFGAIDRTFSAGIGVKAALGFTEYAVDYTFQPIPDYGIVHNFGFSVYF